MVAGRIITYFSGGTAQTSHTVTAHIAESILNILAMNMVHGILGWTVCQWPEGRLPGPAFYVDGEPHLSWAVGCHAAIEAFQEPKS